MPFGATAHYFLLGKVGFGFGCGPNWSKVALIVSSLRSSYCCTTPC
jgi:hypothetical protein